MASTSVRCCMSLFLLVQRSQECCFLLGKLRGHFCIEIPKHILRWWRWYSGSLRHGLLDLGRTLFEDLVLPGFRPLLPLVQVLLYPEERIARPPGLDFRRTAILSWVVRRGMRTQTIRIGFDQCRTLTTTRPFDRLAHHRIDGKQVVAIKENAGEAIGQGLLGNGRRGGLRLT